MRSSTGEIKIYNILTAHDIPFVEEYEFPDLITSSGRHLRFDFAVFDDGGLLDFLIEYQGKQHYQAVPKFGGDYGLRKQKYNDELKRRYCFLHNINLVIIPFWEENILSYEHIMKKAGY